MMLIYNKKMIYLRAYNKLVTHEKDIGIRFRH